MSSVSIHCLDHATSWFVCFPGSPIQPVDLSDKPVFAAVKRAETPRVVTDTDVEDTYNHLECLHFDIETEVMVQTCFCFCCCCYFDN